MKKQGYNGTYTLRIDRDGKLGPPVEVGSFVLDFRGDGGKLEGGRAPHKQGSNGHVTVDGREYYASVWGLEWRKDD